MEADGKMSALSWTVVVCAVGICGTTEAITLGAVRGAGCAAYVATWVTVWLMAEHRIRRPSSIQSR